MTPTAIDWLLEQMRINNYISKKQYNNASWLIAEAKDLEIQLHETTLFKEREMLVSDDGERWQKRVVFCRNPKLEFQYIAYSESNRNKHTGSFWKYAKELYEQDTIPEYTIEELTEKIGHEFKIKK